MCFVRVAFVRDIFGTRCYCPLDLNRSYKRSRPICDRFDVKSVATDLRPICDRYLAAGGTLKDVRRQIGREIGSEIGRETVATDFKNDIAFVLHCLC